MANTTTESEAGRISEAVAGFGWRQMHSMDEAIACMKHCTNPLDGQSVSGIRAEFEMEYLGEACTPALREQGHAELKRRGGGVDGWFRGCACSAG